jgi:hypothetical protein
MLADAPPRKPGAWPPQPTLPEFEGIDGMAASAGDAKKSSKKKPARS